MAKMAGRNIGQEIAEALGLIRPEEIARIVIDVRPGGEIIVHTERYFSTAMLGVVRTLEGVEVSVKEAGAPLPLVEFCTWCPDPASPLVQHHPDGGPEHREGKGRS